MFISNKDFHPDFNTENDLWHAVVVFALRLYHRKNSKKYSVKAQTLERISLGKEKERKKPFLLVTIYG